MIELTDDDYNRVAHLAASSPLTVESRAVISGANPGWVFVDRIRCPRVALVWAQGMEGFYLLGDEPPEDCAAILRSFLREVLVDRLRHAGVSWIEISASSAQGEAVIQQAFADRNLEYGVQWIYRNAADGEDLAMASSEVVSLSAMDCGSVSDTSLATSKIEAFWGSVDAFARWGLGYGVVVGGELVALCMSAFVDEKVHTVDIQTAAPHRRRGYAFSAAVRFMAACADKGYAVHWDCMATNEASWRLAERLGLRRIATYRCYYFEIPH